MRQSFFLVVLLACLSVIQVKAEDPSLFYDWTVTYGIRSPLGVPQQVILINNQFPGPPIEAVTNNNVIVNVVNKLDEPFLITWNGIKQRRTSWQDGVLGTNCPIPPNSNWTYKFQVKDQIGTFNYFASTALHKAAGAYGALNVIQRSVIFVPYPQFEDDFTLLIADWYNLTHKALRQKLDAGYGLPSPNGLLINGVPDSYKFTGEAGKTYMFRISNVGISSSINFRIQGHIMRLIEVEGAHTLQEMYESLDVHPGQSVTVLVTLHGSAKNYYIVASTRFTKPFLTAIAILHYNGSTVPAAHPLPIGPTYHIHWSMKQARTIRLNLTANAARPNPQGSFHYGTIPIGKTIILSNSEIKINNKLRYSVNNISHLDPETPLKLADWYNIPDVFTLTEANNSITNNNNNNYATIHPHVIGTELHDFVEIVFQNNEKTVQSWHMDGTSAFVVAYGPRLWTPAMRNRYNLVDAVARHTFQVYPASWTVILASLDNKGMWNLRSQIWARRYLGQQLYVRVWNDEKSLFTEADIPLNALFCGKAKRL